jgi:eukaryotic-like serine/threonine-protein kinase
MTLSPGARIGSYTITASIGAGGMGEVYRAHDTRLDRDVALKILPEPFAADPNRVARFEREAKTLAALNHPNIAQIYGLEEGRALVMELVPGETLADRIARGPLPLDEALPIARQIAEALEAAHEQGVIHRDLKPANIKVREDGTVKVLDFGLAKLVESGIHAASPDAPALSQSPTLTGPALTTQAGVLLGTAAYMSPEQAKGRPADKRSDLWAFGCVFYEMLTGRRAFPGTDVADTLAAVLRAEPDWSRLSPHTPPLAVVLLRASLDKDPQGRPRTMSAASFALGRAASHPIAANPGPGAGRTATRPRTVLVWSAVVLMVALLLPANVVHWRELEPSTRPVRFEIALAGNVTFGASHVVSPDGRYLAYVTGDAPASGGARLWVRPLDSVGAVAIAEVPSVMNTLFWSPDSRYLLFTLAGELVKVAAGGGPLETVAAAPGVFRGGTVNADGVVILGSSSGLVRLRGSGSEARQLTAIDTSKGDLAHEHPFFLPDGVRFIYLVTSSVASNSGIYLGSLEDAVGSARRRLTAADSGAVYAPGTVTGASGHLLFLRGSSLYAQPFDDRQAESPGEVILMASGVGRTNQRMPYVSASATGVLAYRAGTPGTDHLGWVDGAGKSIGKPFPSGDYSELALSPDETRLLATLPGTNSTTDIVTIDLRRRTITRATVDTAFDRAAIWAPNSKRIVFTSTRSGAGDLYIKDADTAPGGERLLLRSPDAKVATSWSRDGRSVLFTVLNRTTAADIWVLTVEDPESARPFIVGPFGEGQAQFSPDGKWVAYVGSENPTLSEVFVTDFPGGTRRIKVSSAGGVEPYWSADGEWLYYRALAESATSTGALRAGTLRAVQVSASGDFEVRVESELFPRVVGAGGISLNPRYAPAKNGHFIAVIRDVNAAPAPIVVTTNWTAALPEAGSRP